MEYAIVIQDASGFVIGQEYFFSLEDWAKRYRELILYNKHMKTTGWLSVNNDWVRCTGVPINNLREEDYLTKLAQAIQEEMKRW